MSEARVRLAPKGMTLAAASRALNSATYWLRLWQVYSDLPAPVANRKALKQIIQHAAALRSLLQVVDDDGLAGTGANPRVVEGIALLLVHRMRGAMDERFVELNERSGEVRRYDEIFGTSEAEPALLVLAELLGVVITAAQQNLGDHSHPTRAVKEPSPLMHFTKSASAVYLKLTGQTRLVFSRTAKGTTGGPLIRFLSACAAQVGEEVQPEILAT